MSQLNLPSSDDDHLEHQLVCWTVRHVPAAGDESESRDSAALVPLSDEDVARILDMALGLAPVGSPPRYLPLVVDRSGRRRLYPAFFLTGILVLVIGTIASILAYQRWHRPVVPGVRPRPSAGSSRGSGSAHAAVAQPAGREWLIDDGDPGFHTVGPGWASSRVGGYQGAHHYGIKDALLASWNFEQLDPGRYEVFLSWAFHENRAWQVPLTLYDGDLKRATVLVNQSIVPSDLTYQGTHWKRLGDVEVNSGRLVVELDPTRAKVHLGRDYGSSISADAVLIRRVTPPQPAPETPPRTVPPESDEQGR